MMRIAVSGDGADGGAQTATCRYVLVSRDGVNKADRRTSAPAMRRVTLTKHCSLVVLTTHDDTSHIRGPPADSGHPEHARSDITDVSVTVDCSRTANNHPLMLRQSETTITCRDMSASTARPSADTSVTHASASNDHGGDRSSPTDTATGVVSVPDVQESSENQTAVTATNSQTTACAWSLSAAGSSSGRTTALEQASDVGNVIQTPSRPLVQTSGVSQPDEVDFYPDTSTSSGSYTKHRNASDHPGADRCSEGMQTNADSVPDFRESLQSQTTVSDLSPYQTSYNSSSSTVLDSLSVPTAIEQGSGANSASVRDSTAEVDVQGDRNNSTEVIDEGVNRRRTNVPDATDPSPYQTSTSTSSSLSMSASSPARRRGTMERPGNEDQVTINHRDYHGDRSSTTAEGHTNVAGFQESSRKTESSTHPTTMSLSTVAGATVEQCGDAAAVGPRRDKYHLTPAGAMNTTANISDVPVSSRNQTADPDPSICQPIYTSSSTGSSSSGQRTATERASNADSASERRGGVRSTTAERIQTSTGVPEVQESFQSPAAETCRAPSPSLCRPPSMEQQGREGSDHSQNKRSDKN